MNIFIYGKRFEPTYSLQVERLFEILIRKGITVYVYEKFHRFLKETITVPDGIKLWHSHEDVRFANYLISIGGDGTLLDTASKIRDSNVPVIGVNTGRLGFLSLVGLEVVEDAIESLINSNFSLDRRSLIALKCKDQDFGEFPYALNEVTLLNKDRNSMITIHAYVNDLYMSTYWADGLIIATPTGSTAYSLSCGGPIVTPDSNNFILTPIAPHNLNVRPLLLSNDNRISLRAEGRDPQYLLSIDSKSYSVEYNSILELSKAPFELNLISFEGQNFFNTIRNKLSWGMDKRN